MAKDRLERDELASKLVATAESAKDPVGDGGDDRRLCNANPHIVRS